jgi:hypothetical protein
MPISYSTAKLVVICSCRHLLAVCLRNVEALNLSQPYGPPWPVTGISLPFTFTYGMKCPRVAGENRKPQAWGGAAHTPNTQKRAANRRSSSSLKVGWGANNPSLRDKEIHAYQIIDAALTFYGFFGWGEGGVHKRHIISCSVERLTVSQGSCSMEIVIFYGYFILIYNSPSGITLFHVWVPGC